MYYDHASPILGTSNLVVKVNSEEVMRYKLAENETRTSISAIDASSAVNDYYSANRAKEMELEITIEDFVKPFETAEFSLNFIMEANYTEKLPESKNNENLALEIIKDPPMLSEVGEY